MSTAAHDPSPFDEANDPSRTKNRRLQSVPAQPLTIRPMPRTPATKVYQVGKLGEQPSDPLKQFAPAKYITARRRPLVAVRATVPGDAKANEDRLYAHQRTAIQNMTRTIGAAFIEAELGIRPYMQLSAWMELDLFQKLRSRIEHTVNGKYLATQLGDEACKKVPAIVPIGVRAARQANGDWETSLTIRVGPRARAIAMRLQLHRDRWRVIAFEAG